MTTRDLQATLRQIMEEQSKRRVYMRRPGTRTRVMQFAEKLAAAADDWKVVSDAFFDKHLLSTNKTLQRERHKHPHNYFTENLARWTPVQHADVFYMALIGLFYDLSPDAEGVYFDKLIVDLEDAGKEVLQ